jgi:hypothetical protein
MGPGTLSAGPELASKILKRWFHRRRPDPPRAVRIVLQVDDKTVIDINSKLALAMVDCEYGKPVSIPHVLVGPVGTPTYVVKLTFSEVEP